MTSDTVLLTFDGPVAVVSMNRPDRHNAFNDEMDARFFEILTELPIDWEKAERLEAQPDEPWRKPNMRKPDMLLTAEAGWLGDMTHGRNRMAEARKALNEYRAEEGLDPIDWSESAENSEQARSAT